MSETPAVRVVPSIPTFSVDNGFWYSIPDGMDLEIGAVVRVPLSGRRVKGFVIETGSSLSERLKPVASRSGKGSVFDEALLDTLLWAAEHYVAPVSVMLERSAPPKVPPVAPESAEALYPNRSDPLPPGQRVVWITSRFEGLTDILGGAASVGGSAMVVAATEVEADRFGEALRAAGLDPVVVGSQDSNEQVTKAWRRCQKAPAVLIGTPRIVGWKIPRLRTAVIVEDGRRAMKDRQTPTVHGRDLLIHRGEREGFRMVIAGPTPSVEAIAWAERIHRDGGRSWGLVEVVDTGTERGMLAETTKQAIRAVVREKGRVFVFAHRRGYAAAVRCVRCRHLRKCTTCGSSPDIADSCPRCGAPTGPCVECGGTRFEPLGSGVGRVVEELRRVVSSAGPYPSDSSVTCGTERDLAELEYQDLIVMVDADGLVFGRDYRAAEEALRIGARLANRVRKGRRMIVQTSEPKHPAIEALRQGDPLSFLEGELSLRSQFGYPPAGELLVIAVKGALDVGEVNAVIGEACAGNMVLGPAVTEEGTRWLIQGNDLSEARIGLRQVVGRLREKGLTVRVDADPIDL